jgi:hypothetical protein
MGGHEANRIQALYIEHLGNANGNLDRSLVNLYAANKLETLFYNNKRYPNQGIEGATWQRNVRQKSLINLIDPLMYEFFRLNYLFFSAGRSDQVSIWNHGIGTLHVTPRLGYFLIPCGEAYELGASMPSGFGAFGGRLTLLLFKNPWLVDAPVNKGFFLSFFVDNAVVTGPLSADTELIFARQPYFTNGTWSENASSMLAQVDLKYRIGPAVALILGFTKKGRGYFPGYLIDSSSVMRVGMSIPQL